MLEERALVVALQGDAAVVEINRKSACGGCQSNGVCGTSAVASLLGQRKQRLLIADARGARVGQTVVLGMEESELQSAAMVAYLLPIFGLILGALAGQWLGGLLAVSAEELASVVGGIFGMLLAMLAVRWIATRWVSKSSHQICILNIENFDRGLIQESL